MKKKKEKERKRKKKKKEESRNQNSPKAFGELNMYNRKQKDLSRVFLHREENYIQRQ